MAGTTTGIDAVQNGSDIDITLYQGKTVNFQFIWGGDTPIDVTGWDARMQVRTSVLSTAVVAEFTKDNGRITVGTTNGLFIFSMSAIDSALLSAMTGVYDFELITPAGTVYLAMSGQFKITPEVTR